MRLGLTKWLMGLRGQNLDGDLFKLLRWQLPPLSALTETPTAKIGQLNNQGNLHMNRQSQILAWATSTFGPVAEHVDERAARVVEEAIELGQSVGLPKEVVHRILDRVYSRPPGELGREIGGTGMTLEAFAEVAGYDVDDSINREFVRVLKVDKATFEKKHADKVRAGTADLTAVAQ